MLIWGNCVGFVLLESLKNVYSKKGYYAFSSNFVLLHSNYYKWAILKVLNLNYTGYVKRKIISDNEI